MKNKHIYILILLQFITAMAFAQSGKFIFPDSDVLKQRAGKVDTVFGMIYGGAHVKEAGVTLLSLGDVYPNQPLTIVIRDEDLKKFRPSPEIFYKDTIVSVVGKVELVKGRLQITLKDTSQLHLPYRVRVSYKAQSNKFF